MGNDVYLTRAGFEKLNKELDQLKMERVRISKAIEEARLQGDISENAEYDAAKEAQAHNVAKIVNVEEKLSSVRIIEDQNITYDKIYIGAVVTLLDIDTDEKIKYMMVSPEEANYEENKLSIFAPIGKALMGHSKGEELKIKVPAGVLKYKILKIAAPS